MKTVLVILDGLGDDPIPELGHRTPLEAAFAPNLHYIASRGRIGCLQTTFPGYPIESMVCIMGLLGYEPSAYYPGGRAGFEAMAKGIPLDPQDLILRCNTITVDLEQQILTDFTAGLISDSDARTLISKVKLPFDDWELYPGQSYRNLLIIRRTGVDPMTLRCGEPHMRIGEPVGANLPTTDEGKTRNLCEDLRRFLLDSQRQIAGMDLPEGIEANMLWVWSPSRKPVWPTFKSRTGLRAACVGGLDFLHGISMAAGIHFDVIPGATGYIDTNYQAKAEYTLRYLRDFDLVLTHLNATDEEAHQRSFRGKVTAIEKADALILGPILRELESAHKGNYRLVVCGDHNTRCRDGKHTGDLVPYAAHGAGLNTASGHPFTEPSCLATPPISSLEVVPRLILGSPDGAA